MASKSPLTPTYNAEIRGNPQSSNVSLEDAERPGVQKQEVYQFKEARKLGVTSSVFLILNKMIGTGSKYIPLISSKT